MKKKKRKPSLLNKVNFPDIASAIEVDGDASVTEICLHFGYENYSAELKERYGFGQTSEDYLVEPCQIALDSFCIDNPKINSEGFSTWYKKLIGDEQLFRFNRNMWEAVKETRQLFDEKMNGWTEKGVLDAEYDTSYAFWGIIGLTIYDISYHIRTKWNQLSDDKFFVNPLFGK